MELNKLCRTCLSASENMKSLYETCATSSQICCADMLSTLTPLLCFGTDGLPTKICPNCIGELNRLNAFRTKCLESDTILRNYLDKDAKTEGTNIIEEVFVKCETPYLSNNSIIHQEKLNSKNNESNYCDITIDPSSVTLRNYLEKDVKTEDDEVVEKSPLMLTSNSIILEENSNSENNSLHYSGVTIDQSSESEKSLKDPLTITEMQEVLDQELDLVKHEVDVEIKIEKDNNVQTIQQDIEKPYSCTVCNKPFKQKQYLKMHMRTHTGEKPYTCTVCNMSFKHKPSLKFHIRTHTGEYPYPCTVCDRSFNTKQHLSYHMGSHTGEKSYTCTMCNNSYRQRQNLKIHMRSHTREKPYTCTVCNKSYTQNHNLKIHIRTHTGEKPYACTVCDSSFNQKQHLTFHMRTHTGEKPYTCTVCDSSFGHKHSLQFHERMHTGEKTYSCTACDRSFRTRQRLTHHLRKHTGEKP